MDKVFFADRDDLHRLMGEWTFLSLSYYWHKRNIYPGERGMIRGVRVIEVFSSEQYAEEYRNLRVEVVTDINELLPKPMIIPKKTPQDVAKESIGWTLIVLLICSPVLLLAILFSLIVGR